MKQTLSFLFCFLLFAIGAYAQPGKLSDEKRKEFEAQKIAFFTQCLDLSPEEALLFWPLYNEMQKKRWEVEHAMKSELHKFRTTENIREEAYIAAIKGRQEAEQKMLDIKKEYYAKMLAVLPASKIWRLDDAEWKFHRQLFDKLRREPEPRK